MFKNFVIYTIDLSRLFLYVEFLRLKLIIFSLNRKTLQWEEKRTKLKQRRLLPQKPKNKNKLRNIKFN